MKKVSIDISGLYFWGRGISPELSVAFDEVVTKACKRMDLESTVSDYGIIEGRKGSTYVYFHPMTIEVKGSEYGAGEVARIIKEEIDSSELVCDVTIRK